jgi:hypothetical protein
MTFNNCDRAEGTQLFERHFMSYTPEREIINKAKSIGYIVTYNFRLDSSNNWLELQRPGQLTSLKGGQSLAKIVYNDDSYKYTSEEQRNIRHQAADLNINTPQVLKQIPVGQIVELIKQRKKEE